MSQPAPRPGHVCGPLCEILDLLWPLLEADAIAGHISGEIKRRRTSARTKAPTRRVPPPRLAPARLAPFVPQARLQPSSMPFERRPFSAEYARSAAAAFDGLDDT